MWEYGSMGVVAGMRIEEGWQSEVIYIFIKALGHL